MAAKSSNNFNFRIGDIMSAQDCEEFFTQYAKDDCKRQMVPALIDYIGARPDICEKLKARGVLLTYFCYFFEHAFKCCQLSFNNVPISGNN